jgi:predicted PurR-regulated permease PerM
MWPGSPSSTAVNGVAGMVIAAVLVATLYAGRESAGVLALAGILSFVLAPLVRKLVHAGLPHRLSVALVVAILFGGLFAGATLSRFA